MTTLLKELVAEGKSDDAENRSTRMGEGSEVKAAQSQVKQKIDGKLRADAKADSGADLRAEWRATPSPFSRAFNVLWSISCTVECMGNRGIVA